MKNKSSSINLNEFHNFIFHFLFFFILSAQIFFTHNYLNSLYVLGIILFIRADYEYNWKLILIISIYGLYQDALLGFQFGFSSMFFLFLRVCICLFIGTTACPLLVPILVSFGYRACPSLVPKLNILIRLPLNGLCEGSYNR